MNRPRKFQLTLGGMLILVAAIALGIASFRPATTRFTDVKLGAGPAAKAGDTLEVHYVGKLADGTKFDSSRDRNTPFEIRLGAGMVIPGWDVGLAGMQAGGVRTLVIPPNQGYGEKGVPPVIPPNSTLNFEVELLKIK